MENEYNTDSSFESLYGVDGDMEGAYPQSLEEKMFQSLNSSVLFGTASTGQIAQSSSSGIARNFGTQFQELFMRAFIQSTASMFSPSPGVMVGPQQGSGTNSANIVVPHLQGSTSSSEGVMVGPPDGSQPSSFLAIEGADPATMWNAGTFNIAEARRKRKMHVSRTSAGEGSDSQNEFPIPENETPQQRSLRTRRLNRYRVRRARELTNNRRALKKLPHVVFVDGTAKARGIHRHLWRAAVRGQCRRLDPTMDNINHHPKQIVDSIWHALEKEWELEGFAHRGREMFERAAKVHEEPEDATEIQVSKEYRWWKRW